MDCRVRPGNDSLSGALVGANLAYRLSNSHYIRHPPYLAYFCGLVFNPADVAATV